MFENARFETGMNERSNNDKDRFTSTELAALRSDLLQGGMIDSYEAAELLQVFLMGRGYGCPRCGRPCGDGGLCFTSFAT